MRYAESRDPSFGFDGLEVRRCVIKTVYLRRRLDSILHRHTATSVEDEDGGENEGLKLLRFYRRTVMELYVLNRSVLYSSCPVYAIGTPPATE